MSKSFGLAFKVFLFSLLIFLSLIPRSVEVLSNNYLFLLDQGRDYMAVKRIVTQKHLTLIGAEVGSGFAGFSGIFHGPFYFYLLSIAFILLRGDPWGGIVVMFLFGIVTIFLSFLFAKKLFGPTIGILCALLVAVSPPLIAQSRFIWSPHPSSFFIVAAFYFVYRMRLEKKRDIFFSAFFSAFTYNFQLAIAVPLVLTLMLYSLFIIKMKTIKAYGALFAGYAVGFLPFILFELRHGMMGVWGMFSYLFLQPKENLKFILNNHLSSFTYNFFDTFPRTPFTPQIFLQLLFVVSFLFFFLKEKKLDLKRFLIYLLFLISFTIFVFSFLRDYLFMYYIIHLNFVYIFLCGYIVYSAFTKKKYPILGVFIFILFFMVLLAAKDAIRVFTYDMKDYGGDSKIKGKKDAIDYIYKDAKGQPFGLFIFSPTIYTYPFDYILWWYGQRTYHYLPKPEKKGIFYLLIEVEKQKPWTYKGWLETVIKEGEILKTVTLPSGLMVQKRII